MSPTLIHYHVAHSNLIPLGFLYTSTPTVRNLASTILHPLIQWVRFSLRTVPRSPPLGYYISEVVDFSGYHIQNHPSSVVMLITWSRFCWFSSCNIVTVFSLATNKAIYGRLLWNNAHILLHIKLSPIDSCSYRSYSDGYQKNGV